MSGTTEHNTKYPTQNKVRTFSAEGLEYLIQYSTALVMISDEQGNIHYANKLAKGVMISPDDYAGRKLDSLFEETQGKALLQLVENLITEEEITLKDHISFELPNKRKIIYEIAAHNLLKVEEIGGIVIEGRDITSQEKTKGDLKYSSDIFTAAFHANKAMCTITDYETGIFLDVNQSWEEGTGYSRHEIIGKTAVDLDIWDSKEVRDYIVDQLVEHGKLTDFVTEVNTRHKGRIIIQINAEVLDLEVGAQLFFSSIDITEQLKDAEKLKNSEERLRDLLEYSTDWFWETNAAMEFTVVSDTQMYFKDFDKNRILGKNMIEFLQRRNLKHIADQIKSHTDRHVPFRNVYHEFTRRNGETKHLLYHGKPIFNGAGQFVGYRGTGTDITAQEEATREKIKAEEKLQQSQKMEAIGQLTGGIAHDFNNLLSVIIGNAEFLMECDFPNSAIKSQVEAIIRAGENGAELTQNLLAFSRKQVLSPRELDIADQLKPIIKVLSRTFEATIKIETEIEKNLWTCWADPGQVENVLLNLSNNSRDAMPGGGTLTIRIFNKHIDADSSSKKRTGDYIVLSVSDTGTGMSDETKAHIFEPFYTTKEVGQGTGLGLSMVYGFAEQSGGFVKVESNLGEGTTICLYLPRKLPSTSAVN